MNRYLFGLVLVVSFLSSPHAHAIFRDNQPISKQLEESTLIGHSGNASDYQIGSEAGKKRVTKKMLQRQGPIFARAAMATAHYGGGTAFYLGKINGHHMMATNHHVMPKAEICENRSAIFPILGKKFHCEKFYGDWTAIDLALFSITVENPKDEAKLAKVARNFNFDAAIFPGQELITIGFGVFHNPGGKLMANADSDCKVFSAKNEFRFLADPDLINPATYKAWSFAMGCDASHGDSGSAIVDRKTGDVIGLIWTVATNKDPRIQDSKYLDELLKRNDPQIWSQLSYAVPAPKIRSFLAQWLDETKPDDRDLVDTIHAVFQASSSEYRQ